MSDDPTGPEYPDHDAAYREEVHAAKHDLTTALSDYPMPIRIAATAAYVSEHISDWCYATYGRQYDAGRECDDVE